MTGRPSAVELLAQGEGLLTLAERSRLAELEQVVDAGLQTFVEVGLALREIRDEHLYRDTHPTFGAYLDDRWSIKRAHGYRLIDGARVAELVSPMGDIPNERQARELVPLLGEPDELVEVVRELRAEHGDQLTAEKVKAAVDERLARDKALAGIKTSAGQEWYTPARHLEAVRRVLGAIDLDPASTALANEDVGAERFYTLEEDGLERYWHGRVFLNPPFDRAREFVAKLLAELDAGRVEAAIVILNAQGFGDAWWQPLWRRLALLCFTDHRVPFWSPSRPGGSPLISNVFVYLGPEPARFEREFAGLGHIVEERRVAQ